MYFTLSIKSNSEVFYFCIAEQGTLQNLTPHTTPTMYLTVVLDIEYVPTRLADVVVSACTSLIYRSDHELVFHISATTANLKIIFEKINSNSYSAWLQVGIGFICN